MDTIGINKNEIVEFFNGVFLGKNLDSNLLDITLKFMPCLCNYFEESEKIIFDLCVCVNIDSNRSVSVKKFFTEDLRTLNQRIFFKRIKALAIFCKSENNIYVCQKDDEVHFGLWEVNYGNGISAKEAIIEENAVVFSCIDNKKISIKSKGKEKYIYLGISDEDEISDLKSVKQVNGIIRRAWNEIFCSAKRIVHGTMCLVVSSDWNSNDESFKKMEKKDMISLEDLDLNINISDLLVANTPNYKDFIDAKNKFLDMLNYDGITIIDNEGRIRAYNAFANMQNDSNCSNNIEEADDIGGARTRAKNFLKKSKNDCYLALYYQSQEGNIEFWDYKDGCTYKEFNANIMDRKERKDNKDFYSLPKFVDDEDISEINQVTELWEAFNDLLKSHHEINNFYKEPEKANAIIKLFLEITDKKFNAYLSKYIELLRICISSLLQCRLGSASGVSNRAQEDLKEIIDKIDFKNWKKYMDECINFDSDLLWLLAYDGSPRNNWDSLIEMLRKNGKTDVKFKVSKKDALISYRDLFSDEDAE